MLLNPSIQWMDLCLITSRSNHNANWQLHWTTFLTLVWCTWYLKRQLASDSFASSLSDLKHFWVSHATERVSPLFIFSSSPPESPGFVFSLLPPPAVSRTPSYSPMFCVSSEDFRGPPNSWRHICPAAQWIAHTHGHVNNSLLPQHYYSMRWIKILATAVSWVSFRRWHTR